MCLSFTKFLLPGVDSSDLLVVVLVADLGGCELRSG